MINLKQMFKNYFNFNITDRNEVTKKFLASGTWENGIDVGGRQSVILNSIQCENKYCLDFHNEASPSFSGSTLLHNLEHGLPLCKGDKWDLIIANDVIEHVENKNKLVTDIFQNCNSDVVISLPNTQHYRYVKGLVRGDMGKQFVFNVEDGVDRHKWVTFYKDNIQWLQHKAMENNFELIGYEDINLLTSKKQLLFLFSRNRKNYFVFNQVFHFRRTSI